MSEIEMENLHEVALTVDARELACPMPLLKAKQALAKCRTNQLVRVLATDPSSVRDFRSFIDLTDHKLIDFVDNAECYTFFIRKG